LNSRSSTQPTSPDSHTPRSLGGAQITTIKALGQVFERAIASGLVPERTIRRWQAKLLHQFILAGAYRRLRVRRRAEAGDVLRLFDLPEVRNLGASPKWLPVRAAFTVATVGARRVG
jgi:hypothetical protein